MRCDVAVTTDTGQRARIHVPDPWGDRRDSRYVLEVGKRAKAAEAPWRLVGEPTAPRDTTLDFGRVGDLVVRVASTRGSSHRVYATPREDAAAVLNVDDRFVALVVADGIGSAPGAAEAAQLAVEYSLHRLPTRLAPETEPTADRLVRLLHEAVEQANAALEHARQGGPPATTLTIAVVSAVPRADGGGYPYAVYGIGNSPAYVLEPGGGFKQVYGQTSGGPVHSTATAGLPAKARKYSSFTDHLTAGSMLLLATDGLGDPLSFEEVQAELARHWWRPPDPVDFLTQVQFRRRSYDDDRSAAAVWAPGGDDDPSVEQRLPLADLAAHGLPKLPNPRVLLDAGRVGNLEVRAVSVHQERDGAVGAVTVGDDRVLAAIVQGPSDSGRLDQECRRLLTAVLASAQRHLLQWPQASPEAALGRALGEVPQGYTARVAVVDVERRYAVALTGKGAAYRLTDGNVEPVTGAVGRLAPGEALVLTAGTSPRPMVGKEWATPPGPSAFLDDLSLAPGDRAAVAIWATSEGGA